nr:NAD nucleotidase [uncultured Desulfuromonas sp.]
MRHRIMPYRPLLNFLLITLTLLLVSACSDSNSSAHRTSVKILHVNDVHSHLDSDSLDLTLDGTTTEVEVGGMARVASLIDDLSAENDNHLVLHAGDAVQGTLYYTLFQGEADAEVMNAIGFDAMCIGNHEFDDGDEWLAGFIDQLDAPVISANIEVASGNVLEGKFSPYIIKEVGGTQVGIIGVTIAGKTEESSQPSAEVTFHDEIESVQAAVDELTAAGIGKIIVLSHYGYNNVQTLATQVSDIDVIIDGDSHTLLGDFSPYDLADSGDYPTMTTNADGDDVCIVQAWEYSKVLGELDVTFVGNALESCSGTPHLLLGDTFVREDADENEYTVDGDELAGIQDAIAADDQLTIAEEDPTVAAIIADYAEDVDALGETVIGEAGEDLLLSRVPGHDYYGVNLPLGSDITPVVAKAFYEMDPNAEIAIQNGGGVRTSVTSGEITYDTAYTLLPFANTLYEIEMYGSEIKQVLEDAIENIAQGGSTGGFPYAYALKYDVDATQAFGSRVSNLEYKARGSENYVSLEDNTLYVVITNSYTAAGRDGYETFGTVQEERGLGVDTYLDYALSFVNYVEGLTEAGETLVKLPPEDHCIKSYIATPDTTDNL